MLGHASAAMTLDVYSGLFDDDLDAVADRMDALLATDVPQMCHRCATQPSSVIFRITAQASDLGFCQWGGWGSNPRPTDYEGSRRRRLSHLPAPLLAERSSAVSPQSLLTPGSCHDSCHGVRRSDAPWSCPLTPRQMRAAVKPPVGQSIGGHGFPLRRSHAAPTHPTVAADPPTLNGRSDLLHRYPVVPREIMIGRSRTKDRG
jgi:hypothetical protein